MNDGTNTLEAQAHVADSRLRRKRAWRLFWGVIAAFSLLLLAIPAVGYLIWQAHGRQLLRDEIAEISASGEPFTTANLAAWHSVSRGQRDITAFWVEATEPFAADQNTFKNVPIIGDGNSVPFDEPWKDAQVVQDYLSQRQRELAALHEAARQQGEVRYPYNFKKGIDVESFDTFQLRKAWRALSLELHHLVLRQQTEAALKNIDTQLALVQTVNHQPYLIGLVTRASLQTSVLEEIQAVALVLPLTDGQLAELQERIRLLQIEKQFTESMILERGFVYHCFHLPKGSDDEMALLEPAIEIETTHDIRRVRSPEDCAMALGIMAEVIGASRLPLPKALMELGKLEEHASSTLEGDAIGRWRYPDTLEFLPVLSSMANVAGQAVAIRELADASLALRRFELKNGALPATLEELVPEYLHQMPVDPFAGRPLRYLPESKKLYSVGRDRVDNSGQMPGDDWTPDIVMQLKSPQ